ncbi:MAG: 1-deoxy-D-xylulose-5-phosphate synthase [Ruminococcaceae bacterium]|nr:1-deoxy-D-xylulose-5-phosphate synthase [Oscillospiraceae bacterium]
MKHQALFDKLNEYEYIKKMSIAELETLCGEIRSFLIDSVSETGGHLASNLGAVELTVALHRTFSFPKDKLIFDVGHQGYVHKILTGRAKKFIRLRKLGGISGFPKVSESEFDTFHSGHSSNSISVALGLKRGLEQQGDDSHVIAMIGDGALTGGMAIEAMNDAGREKNNIIVILNDNEMSISENVGGIAKHLAKMRTSPIYLRTKGGVSSFFSKIPWIGKGLYKFISTFKAAFRNMIIGDNIFEELGFYYAGPFDGHNLKGLCKVFERLKDIDKPMVIHVMTKKGKGYLPAEERPDLFHGVKGFDVKTGIPTPSAKNFSTAFGEALVELGETNKKIVALTAAMPDGTGLTPFWQKFPDRYYDVAIAEAHGAGLSAGLAISGMVPVFAVYSSFLQRAYDQLITDVCGMNLHCVFAVDRSGIVGEDGETHQGVFDISYLTAMPNMTVFSPATFADLRFMLQEAIEEYDSPCAIRYHKGGESKEVCELEQPYERGKAQVLVEGKHVSILCDGSMAEEGLKATKLLAEQGVSAELINLRYIKPLDWETISNSLKKTKRGVVMENACQNGGIYSMLTGATTVPLLSVSIPDCYVPHGKVEELFKMFQMDGESVAKRIMEEFFR